MFTGIVEEVGTVTRIKTRHESMEINIQANAIMSDVKLGDSISISGVCLTVTDFTQDSFNVDVMPETFEATTMSKLVAGSSVNLERALAVGGRMGGHFVTGHVDGVGEIVAIVARDNAINYTIKLSRDMIKYCMFRGSVAIDGISLTIFGVDESSIKLALIPHTVKHTVLGQKKVGDKVNVECDMLSKYVANILKASTGKPIDKELLLQNGFM